MKLNDSNEQPAPKNPEATRALERDGFYFLICPGAPGAKLFRTLTGAEPYTLALVMGGKMYGSKIVGELNPHNLPAAVKFIGPINPPECSE